jgi:predicted transcriptional regulator
MLVSELMQTDLQVISPEAAVNEAAVTLAEAHVSGLPVVDRRGHLVGVISSSDILASEEEVNDEPGRVALFEDTLVRHLMTPRPVTVTPTATVREAAQLLLEADVHRVFVLEEDRLVGVLSTTDIVRAIATGQL